MKRIAINGFGRIGRASLKVILDTADLELVAVNDLMDLENAAYLLTYDSVYGKYDGSVKIHENHLHVREKKVLFFSERDPAKLPWKELNIDVVIESTGLFTKREDAEKHIHAGARTVIISGPTKSENTPTVVHGVNTADGKINIFSCGSCTTNNIGPIIEILGRRLGIKKAILNTVHAFTASQTLVDAPSKREPRMGRSAAINLAPASTGAAIAITKALPQYEGKFDGVAVRTPVPVGSISDITFIAERPTTRLFTQMKFFTIAILITVIHLFKHHPAKKNGYQIQFEQTLILRELSMRHVYKEYSKSIRTRTKRLVVMTD